MATLGSYTLLAAFIACAYAAAAVVAGHRRRAPRLVESGIGSFYLVTALMTLASAIIVRAFVIGDYSIRYVDRYSDSIQPLFYRLTSYWGGLDWFGFALLALGTGVALLPESRFAFLASRAPGSEVGAASGAAGESEQP